MTTPYKSLESLEANGTSVLPSIDFIRLHWFLNSDKLSESISILKDAKNADSPQEPYSIDHPINQEPATHPPVSSITVSVYLLEQYETDWIHTHKPHADPEEFDDEDDPMCLKYDSDDYIKRCCGEDRPGPGPRLTIMAKEGQSISVEQYINTVHAWLREMDSLLRAAEGVCNCWPLDPEYQMMVPISNFTCLMIESTQTWTPENYVWEWEEAASMARKLYSYIPT